MIKIAQDLGAILITDLTAAQQSRDVLSKPTIFMSKRKAHLNNPFHAPIVVCCFNLFNHT